MSGYLNTVIVTVLLCQAAQLFIHQTESYRRIIHILCALVLILTIAKPAAWVLTHLDSAVSAAEEFFAEDPESSAEEDPLYRTAQAMMEHAAQVYGWDRDGMKITLITEETDGVICEIQMYPKKCSYTDRVRAQEELTELYGIPVYIYNLRE